MEEITQLEKKATEKVSDYRRTLLSLIVFTVCMGAWIGWQAGIVLSILLLAHECGHFIEARRLGLKVSQPFFIPFIGAVINIEPNQLKNPQDEAKMGIGGPLYGAIASVLALLIWLGWFSSCKGIGIGIAFSVGLNIVNLVPIRPLDGGRITQIIGPWTKGPGLLLLLSLTIYNFSPILLLIWGAVAVEFKSGYQGVQVSPREKLVWSLGYMLLLGFLIFLLLAVAWADITGSLNLGGR